MSQQQPQSHQQPSTPSSQQQSQQSQQSQIIYIRSLPPYYPTTLHQWNIKLGTSIPQVAKFSNFLAVPPLFLCFVLSSIIFVLIFAKFLVNAIIIAALLFSSIYNCVFMTTVLDTIVFSQVLHLTVSLAFLAIYVLFSSIIDTALDWIPFYHPAKLFIAFSLTYQANSATEGINNNNPGIQYFDANGNPIQPPSQYQQQQKLQLGSDPFPLMTIIDQNGQIQNIENTNNTPQNHQQQLLQSKLTLPTMVPAPPAPIKSLIDLIQAVILLARGYVVRWFRLKLWALRTFAYEVKIKYNTDANVVLNDDDVIDAIIATKKNNQQNNNNNDDNEKSLDDVLEEYGIDDFNNIPDANELEQ